MKSKKIKHKAAVRGNSANDSMLDTSLKKSFWGFLITIAISLALLLCGTAAAFTTDDPTAFAEPIGYVSLLISAFFGGFICAKLNTASPYLTSLFTGIIFLLTLIICALALPHTLSSDIESAYRFILYGAALALFPIGALAGTKSRRSRKPTKKRRR